MVGINGNLGIGGILGMVGKPGNGSKVFMFSTGFGRSWKNGNVDFIGLLKGDEGSDPNCMVVDGFFSSIMRRDAKHK